MGLIVSCFFQLDVRPKKKKKKKASDFILDEAEVDDDADDDEEAYDDYEADDFRHEKDDARRTARDIEAKMRKERGGFGMDDDEMDADQLEEYYRMRYNEDAAGLARFGEGGEEMSDEITQQTLLPGVKDPNLWMVKCLPGTEKQTVINVMNKYIAYQNAPSEEPLQIRSVVAPEHVKGFIYVEAFKQSHVKEVIKGISALRIGQYNQQMVPIKEMTDVLR